MSNVIYVNDNNFVSRTDGPAIRTSKKDLWVVDGYMVKDLKHLERIEERVPMEHQVYLKLSGALSEQDQFFSNIEPLNKRHQSGAAAIKTLLDQPDDRSSAVLSVRTIKRTPYLFTYLQLDGEVTMNIFSYDVSDFEIRKI